MDLVSGTPFWPLRDGLLGVYPPLKENVTCDIAIVGGGITGALIAHELTKQGADCIVLEKRDIGMGSTSASTALLLYEIDVDLHQLMDLVGEDHAVRAYQLCREAIYQLHDVAREVGDECDFEARPSLYLASRRRDAKRIEKEFAARSRHGFQVQLWSKRDIENGTSFSAPNALFTPEGGQIDAFRLTHKLFAQAAKRSLRIFDRTQVTKFSKNNHWMLETNRGFTVQAKQLVFACGYEAQELLRQRVTEIKNTFVYVSEPLDTFDGWPQRCMIWETARPYFYARSTSDNRAMVGGEDVPFKSVAGRDALIKRQMSRLKSRFDAMFPRIESEIAFCYAGTFSETKDGLAYIGYSPEWENALFALGFGGNGITYSIVAARILCDFLNGRPNEDAEIFRFER
jgi:glycine/D-amino acid oxidase-like deaminating enzyme